MSFWLANTVLDQMGVLDRGRGGCGGEEGSCQWGIWGSGRRLCVLLSMSARCRSKVYWRVHPHIPGKIRIFWRLAVSSGAGNPASALDTIMEGSGLWTHAVVFFFFWLRGILVPQPGSEPVLLHWKCSILTPGPPGKSHKDPVLNSGTATFRLCDPGQVAISLSLSFFIYAMELLIPTCRVSWKLYEGWRWKPGRGRCSIHTSIFNLFLLITSACFFFSFLFPRISVWTIRRSLKQSVISNLRSWQESVANLLFLWSLSVCICIMTAWVKVSLTSPILTTNTL